MNFFYSSWFWGKKCVCWTTYYVFQMSPFKLLTVIGMELATDVWSRLVKASELHSLNLWSIIFFLANIDSWNKKVRKGDTIGEFLRAVQQQLAPEFREIRTTSVENLLYVKEDLIIPHVRFCFSLDLDLPLLSSFSANYLHLFYLLISATQFLWTDREQS